MSSVICQSSDTGKKKKDLYVSLSLQMTIKNITQCPYRTVYSGDLEVSQQ